MKERLTGAIILVVLIVLLVPELLSGPKGPAATPPAAGGAASPSSEEPPLRSYTINLGDDSHSRPETANGAAGSSGPPQPTTQAAMPEKDLSESSTWDTAATTDAQAANPNSSPANPAASSTATLSPHTAAAAQAESPPPSASTAPAPNPAARSERPKPNQSVSNGAARSESAGRTAAAAGAKPHVTPAGGESGGWGVQLGVFASKENADRLALDVRTKGFKASVSAVTSGKRKLYRVRVGPAADKSAAQDLQSKLKAAGRPGGTVVPYS